ncbi:MAG: integrase [Archaeoglobaceae archaeon]
MKKNPELFEIEIRKIRIRIQGREINRESQNSNKNGNLCRSGGLNPGPLDYESCFDSSPLNSPKNNSPGNSPGDDGEALIDYPVHRDEFFKWMKDDEQLSMARSLINKLDQVFQKVNPKISHTHQLYGVLKADETKTLRIGLRDFFRFLIQTGKRTESQLIDFKAIVKIQRSGIRTGESAFTETGNIIQAREQVQDDEIRSMLLNIMVYSGLRLQEAVDILNNFNESELHVFDDQGFAYYDLLSMYKRIGSKKAEAEVTKREVVAFMPIEVALDLRPMKINYNAYKSARDLSKGYVNASQIRKWYSSFLDDLEIDEKIINFITGKTPQNVLQKHYLKLLKKAKRTYPQILPELKKELVKNENTKVNHSFLFLTNYL